MRGSIEVIAWWAVLVLVWLGTLNAYSVEELITAAALAVPCAVAARMGRRAASASWSVRIAWARWLWHLPWAVLRDTIAMLAIALRPDRPADDEFETLTLPRERTQAGQDGREALATAVLSATPGSVVVDASDEPDALLVHVPPIRQTSLRRAVTR